MRIFEKSSIAGVTLKNRIIRSATHEGMGEAGGRPMPELTDLYLKLAKGGVGAVVSGFTAVHQGGKAMPNMRMFDDDRYIDDYKKVNDRLRTAGTPLFLQLVHGGGQTASFVTGRDVVAPSPMKNAFYFSSSRGLEEDEIRDIIESFVLAVVRAKKSGFSGVQLHVGHGYLLSEFLSPRVNRRRDGWGGTTENRFRIVAEIIKKSREKVGAYPILAKFSAYDGDRGGMTIEEGKRIAELFQKSGLDALEVTCGGVSDGYNSLRVAGKVPGEVYFHFVPWFRAMPAMKKAIMKVVLPIAVKNHRPLHDYNVNAAESIKKVVDMPVIVVGGIRKLSHIEGIIGGNKADYVALSRPFICEPNLVNNFKSGKQDGSRCMDCGYCIWGSTSGPVRCYSGKLPK